jgi:hypothetical protein
MANYETPPSGKEPSPDEIASQAAALGHIASSASQAQPSGRDAKEDVAMAMLPSPDPTVERRLKRQQEIDDYITQHGRNSARRIKSAETAAFRSRGRTNSPKPLRPA